MSRREARTSWPPVNRVSADTSWRIKEGGVRASASAAESNSASARSKPSNSPSNTSIPKGGTLLTSLAEPHSRKLREHAKLVPSQIYGRDQSLLRSICSDWNLLSELEHRWATVFTLLPQAKSGANDIAVGDSTDSYCIYVIGKLVEEEPAFTFDPAVFVLSQHIYIFARNQADGKWRT